MTEDVFTTCERCNRPIRYGEPLVTIDRNVERMHPSDADQGGEAEVLESVALLQLCPECGDGIDGDRIAALLLEACTKGSDAHCADQVGVADMALPLWVEPDAVVIGFFVAMDRNFKIVREFDSYEDAREFVAKANGQSIEEVEADTVRNYNARRENMLRLKAESQEKRAGRARSRRDPTGSSEDAPDSGR